MRSPGKRHFQYRGVVFAASPNGHAKDGTPCYTCKKSLGEAPEAPVVKRQTFTVYAPVLQSPTNLNLQVDGVVRFIEQSGTWQVTSYSVRSGDQYAAIPLLPKFLQPTVQIMKFVLRRRDGKETSAAAAMATVVGAAGKQGLTFQSIKDWYVEIKEEIVKPSIPSPPNIRRGACELIEYFTGLPCWVVLGAGAVVGAGAVAFIYSPVIVPAITSTRRALFGKQT